VRQSAYSNLPMSKPRQTAKATPRSMTRVKICEH
jgi:hypothetical protein